MSRIPLLSEPFDSHTDESFFKYAKSLEKNVTPKKGKKNGTSKRRPKQSAEESSAEANAGTGEIK